MNVHCLADNIFYVGVDDREKHLFENLWPLPYGVSYNSYLILGSEKTALIDGVEIDFLTELMDHIESTGHERKIDYMVVNHMEPDHSGVIPWIVKAFPEIKLIGNRQTIEMIKGFYHIESPENFHIVADGDEISLGDKTLRFVFTPMVHWPETMMTYCPENKFLFSGDAFGGFGALNGAVLDQETDDVETYFGEMYRYYANIVAKYGRFVQGAFKKLGDTPIEYICSTHGLVWHSLIPRVLDIYNRLSNYQSEEGATVIYGSMYGNTASMAEYIAARLVEKGIKTVRIHKATFENMSQMITDAFRYKYLIVGSPTYSMELFPAVEALMRALQVREIKGKRFAAFSSYTWAPSVALKRFQEYAEAIKMPLLASAQMKQNNFNEVKADLDALVDCVVKEN